MSTLVIVESPTKAKTIRNFLPQGYRVEASMGHIRDLPSSSDEVPEELRKEKWAQLGVNVEANFEPLYIIPKDKGKVVEKLTNSLKDVSELILATDEDREGESISWHLLQILQPKVPIKRMVFHEITREAILSALKHCRDIDEKLVRAQETRRILDRLVGYTLSPLLWKKISRGLSAGRVQSVAVRLLVIRERERRAFRQGSYWDLKAYLEKDKGEFEAKLVTVAGQKVATGSDFDENTGRIAQGRQVLLLDEAQAIALRDRLLHKPWSVTSVEERPVTRKPAPPFTTSTLQQESNRKLRLGARETMKVAQGLYERGFITYMRTDSVNLSEQAIVAARECAEQLYGKEYLSPQPRQYSTKSKGAQEAHEAIRPAGNHFRTPQQLERSGDLSGTDLRLYDLIWKRTVASQMADSRQTNIVVQLLVEDAGFRSSGKRIDFAGFLRAYVEGSDDPEAALEDQEVVLPPMKVGDRPHCQNIEAIGHETQPPARYTEASLVKTLESEGIGRPSTYATIIGTIVDRGYAQIQNNALAPTFTAFAVTALLEKHFTELVDPSFTSKMEGTLDDIAEGKVDWLPYLRNFYSGEKGLETQVKQQDSQIDPKQAKTIDLPNLSEGTDTIYQVRLSKFGPYVEAEKADGVLTASIPPNVLPADLNSAEIEELLRQKAEGPDRLGLHPETGEPVYILVGTYGPYVQLGDITPTNQKPKRASLPKGVTKEAVTLEMAIGLLTLPRYLGEHPVLGGKIETNLGPFGPYVAHDRGKNDKGKVEKEFRSLKKEDDVLTVTLERAIELLAQPKVGRGKKSEAMPALRELGLHPADGEPLQIYDGKYGPYVKHGKKNVSIPKEEVETITLEKVVGMLEAKTATKKTSAKTTTKTTTTKTTTTKTTTKKRSTKSAS